MESYLPNAKKAGRFSRQTRVKKRVLSLHVLGEVFPLAEFHRTYFMLNVKYEIPNSAHVEIYEGSRALFRGMVHYAQREGDLQRFEFKRFNPFHAHVPRDYVDDSDEIAGLIAARTTRL